MREYLDALMERSAGGARFEARVARNALGMVERELLLGPAFAAAHAERLADLGFDDDAALAAALRTGALDGDWESVAPALAASARDQLLVANPALLAGGQRVEHAGAGTEADGARSGAGRAARPPGRRRPPR